MLRIAIAGGARLGMSMVEPLLHSRHEVVAVVQDGRRTRGWNRVVQPAMARVLGGPFSMPGQARALGLPLVWIDKMTETELDPLRKLDIDLLLVSGFGIILKQPLLDLPRIGCVNCHSSLLPRHRGPNPFAAVLLSDDDETGVTFHVMERGIDTGDILDQGSFALRPTDTVLTVYRRCCELAASRVVPLVDRIEREGLRGTPQDADKATYEKNPSVADAWIDWTRSASKIDRQIRALGPSPAPRFRFRGRTVYVLRAKPSSIPLDAEPGTVIENRGFVKVATGQGTILLQGAFTPGPVPWFWPAPWCRPRLGEKLE
ncbi:MAG TPA: methionyl-tRNA formyltransferase [Candidatus Hydrogenedentes bacterium]|nr:methionyl-tRNA formyltransferase [Candidatus Hydrogenedentota bacterium]